MKCPCCTPSLVTGYLSMGQPWTEGTPQHSPAMIVSMWPVTDLEEGELKTAILREAEKTDVSVAEIKVIDGSKRSSHSNAFVSGFWNFRKVVLFDTLIA